MSCKSIKVWWSSLLEHCPSEERMMKTMIPPQVRMRLRTLQKEKKREKKRKAKKKKKAKEKKKQRKKREKKKNNKMREKERRDNATISFSTLVLQNSTMIFVIESLICCHFHILVGIFHYRTWLVYSNDGLPQKFPRSSWASKLDAPHLVSFVELSYIYSSSASVTWQSLLTHIDIY